MTIDGLFEKLWKDYTDLNPTALKIHDLFAQKGQVVNDHVAFRTFAHPKTNIEVFSKVFTKLGYKDCGDYHFEEKKLYAKHFEHESGNYPKVFISELLIDQFSESLQEKVYRYINQIPLESTEADDFCLSGRSWDLTFHEYNSLKNESEYAAWLSAFGFHVNHFTVLINKLDAFKTVPQVNTFLKEQGFKLNDSGGEVKGTPADLLEQSSTLSYNFEMNFSDGPQTIPSCYYEFALRHPKKDGELYQGFVASSADKIFESTDKAQ